ncbi:MAG TPA: glycosyltransferase family 39 protein [Thermodesulfobacteriota bacterium]|nr:glycosyltransferase family 39 protein [Thermodesulfobacteriota bacterium]
MVVIDQPIQNDCKMTQLNEPNGKYLKEMPKGRAVLQRFMSTKFFLCFLLGLSLFILSAHLGLAELWGSEGRWAVIARSMLRSGDLLLPTLGIHSYWDKPLLSYWQILPFAYINGDVSEFAARFPSVIWSLIMLFLAYHLAKRWFGEQTALLSVGTLATTYSFVFWGRNAQVEMTNAAMILLCLWYFIKHKSDPSHTWVYLLGVLMALGANMKGLTLYAVPIFSILLLSGIKRDLSWVPPLKVLAPAGLVSLALFIAVPTVASLHGGTWEPLQAVWRENVMRFFGQYDHKSPVYTYFVKIFYLAAPWSFLLPFAVGHSFRGIRRSLSQTPEALILFGAIFIFFTLSGSRRPYYLLPILPFAAMLVANMLRGFATGEMARSLQSAVRVVWVLVGLAMIGLFGVTLLFPRTLTVGTGALGYVSVLFGLLGAVLIASTIRKYVWGMVGAVFAVWLIYVIGLVPLIEEGSNLKTKAAEVSTLGRPYAFLNIEEAKIVFYLDQPYQVFYDKGHALSWAQQANGVLITSGDFSDPSWECVVNTHHWRAVIPRKNPSIEDPGQSR